jgi:hypothetical protein
MFHCCGRIGSLKGIFTPPLPPLASGPPPPAAAARSQRWRLPQHVAETCRCGAQQGVARLSAAWTGGVGWVTVARQGFTGVEGLGTTGLKTLSTLAAVIRCRREARSATHLTTVLERTPGKKFHHQHP